MLSNISPLPYFVYGTLLKTDLLESLLDHVPLMKHAYLLSYLRYPVHSHIYPAIISEDAAPPYAIRNKEKEPCGVPGILLTALTTSHIEVLDWYEGHSYNKEIVTVRIAKEAMPSNTNMDISLDDEKISKKGDTSTSSQVRDTCFWEEVQAYAYIWSNPISELDVHSLWDSDAYCQTQVVEGGVQDMYTMS